MENEKSSEICTTTQKIMGAKPKATIPLRVLDEEVWFSGSELKTDNDTSDEERNRMNKSIEERIKKGARKKTKTISTTLTKYTRSRKVEGKREKTVVRVTKEDSSISSDASVASKHRHFGENTFEVENACSDFSCNRDDDEKTHLHKINALESRMKRAEQEYMETRRTTEKLVNEMLVVLNHAKDFKEPEWKYFVEITEKWINCFSGGMSRVEIKAGMRYPHDSVLENMMMKTRKRAGRKVSLKCNVLTKYAKQFYKSKTERKNCTGRGQKTHLDILLRNIAERSQSNVFYEPFRLTSEETDRISNIDDKLEAFKSCLSVENENLNELSLTDSEKFKIYNLENSRNENEIDESSHSCDEEFNSCGEDEHITTRQC